MDRRHGQGIFTWTSGVLTGDVYEGSYQFNRKHGPGIYYFDDGDVFRGNFEGDIMMGDFEVEMTFPNNDKYTGTWSDGNMNGQGALVCANGDKYEGAWEANGLCGEGSVVHANGETFQGTWKEHRKSGTGECACCVAFTASTTPVYQLAVMLHA